MFRGAMSSGSWWRAASVSRSFSAAWASTCTSALSADAADKAACSLSRRLASASSRASRAFRFVASRRSATGSMRRLV